MRTNRRALLATVVAGVMLGALPSHAQESHVWTHWGGAPYGTGFDDAASDAKLDFALEELGVPEELRDRFKEAVRADPEGTLAYLDPADHLDGMMSGPSDGQGAHVMRNVTVKETVIAEGGIVRAARAREWRLEYDQRTYRLILPEVCWNWSLVVEDCACSPECVELLFNAPVGGKVRWGVGSLAGPLAPSACSAMRQGDGPWTAWTGQCDECAPAFRYISETLGGNADVPHKYLYEVTESRQGLRFDEEIRRTVVYLCLEYPDGSQTCGVYMRPEDWNGRRSVEIPDSLWRLDDGSCPA